MKTIKTTTFFGNKVSEYGIQNKYVDYGTLAKSFDCVLNNSIFSIGWDIGEWELENGWTDNESEIEELQENLEELNSKLFWAHNDEEEAEKIREQISEVEEQISELEYESDPLNIEVYQWYIIGENGADILKNWTNELVYYNESLDMYLWGVTHYGTSWSYVLTDIRIDDEE